MDSLWWKLVAFFPSLEATFPPLLAPLLLPQKCSVCGRKLGKLSQTVTVCGRKIAHNYHRPAGLKFPLRKFLELATC